jgi:triacylglycerol lipase
VKGYTYTKYPIVLVPGVFSWENLFGLNFNYFWLVESAITSTAVCFDTKTFRTTLQETYFIPLNPWQNTEDRAADLKQKLEKLMAGQNSRGKVYSKVNIIAHSHGSTTSRLAIRWMVQDALNKGKSNPIASLTTIAGPHFGTPTADYFTENACLEGQVALATILNLSGDLVSLFSGPGFDGQDGSIYAWKSDSYAVFNDFSQPGITKFNRDYPSEGLPKGAGAYGEGGAPEGAYAGNGLGESRDVSDPEAILYYSWTGNIGNGWATSVDVADLVMLATHMMNNGHGFTGDADGFIPVKSSHFGRVINDNFFWNHIDEQNQLFGVINPFAEIGRAHV